MDSQLQVMLDESFTKEERDIYLESFKYYLLHGDDDNSFIVNLEDVYPWIGFSRKDVAKRVLLKNLTKSVDYKITQEINHDKGGKYPEQVLLTVDAFKRFCMIAGTEKGKEVQKYYLKLEKIFHRYNRMRLQESNDQIKQLKNTVEQVKDEAMITKHETLINAHDRKRLVYVLRVHNLEDEKFIIKIGETADIKERVQKISSNFGLPLTVTHVFPCEMNREFESFLHNHQKLLAYKYTDVINNKCTSTETYLMKSQAMFDSIIRLIQKNVKFYQSRTPEYIYAQTQQKIIDLRRLVFESIKDDPVKVLEVRDKYAEEDKYEMDFIANFKDNPEQLNSILQTLRKPVIAKTNDDKKVVQEMDKIVNEVTYAEARPCGPKVQVYDAKDITKLLFVYDGITEATRNIPSASFTQIKTASSNKYEYLGYRWFLVDRNNANADKPIDIGETVHLNERRVGLVAMLNLDRTYVMNVFKNQKNASEHIAQHPSAMCTALKFGNPLSGHYWCFWNDIHKDMQDNYLQNNQLPEQDIVKPKGTRIERIDPETTEVMEVLGSITDVCKKYNMSAKTVKKAISNGNTYNGFIWRIGL
jgi:phage anti-repressor protein